MFITLQNLGIRNPHTTQPGRLARGRGSSRQWSHLKEDPRAGSPGSCVRDASPLQCWAESLSSCLAGGCPEFLGCLQWLMASSMSSIHMREQDRARPKSQSFCNLISDVTFYPFHHILLIRGASPPVTQMVKNLPAVWETRVCSLGGEDPLEEGMAAHSSVLAWRIPWTEEPGGLQSRGSPRVGHD